MKKIASVILGLGLIGAAFCQTATKIKIDNEVVQFDAMPRQINGVTMVPLRSMIDAMGASMRWDLATKTVTGWKNSHRFDVVLNSREAVVDDKKVHLDSAPVIIKNRIFVPLKFVADANGYMISVENGWYVLMPNR